MLDNKFWKKYFVVYDSLNKVIPYQELMEGILKDINIKKGDIVLDVGSGTGNLSIKLERKGGRVVGVDFSEAGISIHKKKSSRAKIYKLDLTESLPFPNNSFDKIVSNNVIYAIPQEKRPSLMNELYRVLKPRGEIVISNLAVNFNPIHIYIDHIRKDIRKIGLFRALLKLVFFTSATIKIFYYNKKIKKEHESEYFNFFKDGEQKEMMISAGFSVLGEEKRVYAGQGRLIKGIKK